MRGLKSFLTFVVVLAIIGGGAYAGWYFLIKDKVKDQTPEQAACSTEKGMVQEAVKKATIDRTQANLDDITPDVYIHRSDARKYYTWGGTPPNFVIQPIGAPPC